MMSTGELDAGSSAGTGGGGGPGGGEPTGGETTDPGEGSSGGPPQVQCQDPLPAPTSCDNEPAACGNATPIAWAPDGMVEESALTADDVWFTAWRFGCPGGLYRVSKRGGDAAWVRAIGDVVDFEADDEAVYLVERTEDMFTMRVSALVDGVETVIGETHGDPAVHSYFHTALTRTRAGVVTYWAGASLPSFSRLSPTGLTALATAVEGATLGSAPAYDGERLFFTWSDDPFDADGGPLLRKLVGLSGGTWTELADDATARDRRTVAVDAEHIYFATGDPSTLAGMSVARIAKSGGPPTPLFPPRDAYVDEVLLDDDEVFFGESPQDLFAVAKAGGEPRHVWHGHERGRVHHDETDLYFAVEGVWQEIPEPGRSFIVRVAKDTALP